MNRRSFITVLLPFCFLATSCSYIFGQRKSLLQILLMQVTPFKGFTPLTSNKFTSSAEAKQYLNQYFNEDTKVNEDEVIKKFITLKSEEHEKNDVHLMTDGSAHSSFYFSTLEMALIKILNETC